MVEPTDPNFVYFGHLDQNVKEIGLDIATLITIPKAIRYRAIGILLDKLNNVKSKREEAFKKVVLIWMRLSLNISCKDISDIIIEYREGMVYNEEILKISLKRYVTIIPRDFIYQ